MTRSNAPFKSRMSSLKRNLYLGITCTLVVASALGHEAGITLANEALKTICYVGRSANASGSSGKNEIAVAIMQSTGYSKKTSERIAQKIIDENCPGVW